jgi:hypothetical protein
MISYSDSTSKVLEISIRLDFGSILAVMLALVLFGILYNFLVDWLSSRKYAEGYMSLLVAFGVLGTMIGIALISWPVAVLCLLTFSASGLPMIVGSIARYMRKRAAEQNIYRHPERLFK